MALTIYTWKSTIVSDGGGFAYVPIALSGSTYTGTRTVSWSYLGRSGDITTSERNGLYLNQSIGGSFQAASTRTVDGVAYKFLVNIILEYSTSKVNEYHFTSLTQSFNLANNGHDYYVFTVYEADRKTISLDKHGGSGGTNSVSVAVGEALPSISVPSRRYYSFLGYYTVTGGGGKKYYNSDGTPSVPKSDFLDNTTLYAAWVEKAPVKSWDIRFTSDGDPVVVGKCEAYRPDENEVEIELKWSIEKPTVIGASGKTWRCERFGFYYEDWKEYQDKVQILTFMDPWGSTWSFDAPSGLSGSFYTGDHTQPARIGAVGFPFTTYFTIGDKLLCNRTSGKLVYKKGDGRLVHGPKMYYID